MNIKKGYFSELFPKTFEYLQRYVRVKYPNFKGMLPNPKVIIRNSFLVKHLFGGFYDLYSGSANSVRAHNRITGKMYVYIDQFGVSEQALERIERNPDLAAKLLDSNPRNRTWLIHEYQHILQNKMTINIPEELRRDMVIERAVAKLTDAPRSSRKMSKELLFITNHDEIEARIASMVSFMSSGKSIREAYAYSNFYIEEEKLKRSIRALREGIKEQKESLNKVDKVTRRDTKKKIRKMEQLLWEYEIRLDMIPRIVREAKRIADKIRN